MSLTLAHLFRLYGKIKDILEIGFWKSELYKEIISPEECNRLYHELEEIPVPSPRQGQIQGSFFQTIPTSYAAKEREYDNRLIKQHEERIKKFVMYFLDKLTPLFINRLNTDREFRNKWRELGDFSHKMRSDDSYHEKIKAIYSILFQLSYRILLKVKNKFKRQQMIDMDYMLNECTRG